jgi:hypothetical protein
MNQQVTVSPEKAGAIMEAVIARGDLAALSPEERAKYYARVCESVGLNPLTKPFEYITLNGKLQLYALKGCTDQLRTIHGVSVVDLTETERDGVFIVTAKVENAKGRRDASKGAVTIKGLQGDALANAVMKCETKAKRRATLSICGLGFLDETEIETIPESNKTKTLPKKDARDIYEKLQQAAAAATTRVGLNEWMKASIERIQVLPEDWQDILWLRCQERLLELAQQETAPLGDKTKPGDTVVKPPARELKEEITAQQDLLDIPTFLDRRQIFDEKAWRIEVDRRVASAVSTDELVVIQSEICIPNQKRVSAEGWQWHVDLIRARMAKLAEQREPVFDGDKWLASEFAAALEAADSTAELDEIKNKTLLPSKTKLSADQWQNAVTAYKARVNVVTAGDLLGT